MAIAIDDLKTLDQGSLVIWTQPEEPEFPIPFFLAAYFEGNHWVSPNGTLYPAEALEEVADELDLVHRAVVPEEAKN